MGHRLYAPRRYARQGLGKLSAYFSWLCAWSVLCVGLGVRVLASPPGPSGTPTPLPFQEVFVALAPSEGARIPGVGLTGPVDVTMQGTFAPLSGEIGFTYDPTIALATGTRPGSLNGCSVQTSLGTGAVTVSFDCPAGARVVGVVSEIIFQGVSPGTSALSFSSASGVPDGCLLHGAECLGDPSGLLPIDGSITVGGGTPAAPSLTAVTDVSPATIAAGKTFTLTVTATNAGTVGLTNVGPVGAVQTTSDDGGEVQLVSGPDPPHVATLAQGQQAQFIYQFKATAAGNVTLTVPLGGTDPGGNPVAGQAVCTLPAAGPDRTTAASGCDDSVQITPPCTLTLTDISPPIYVARKTGRILDDQMEPIACGQGGSCRLQRDLTGKFIEVELVPLTAEARQSTKNVGQEVKLEGVVTLNNEALTLGSLQWTVEGQTIDSYIDMAGYLDGFTRALHFSHPPVHESWIPITDPNQAGGDALRFFWKNTGTFAVSVQASAKDGDGNEFTCDDKKTFTIERNQTDPDRQPEDFFTSCCSDAPERVRLTHEKWHNRNDSGSPHPGDDWLNFHRTLTSVFNDWRDFFGYPPVGTYDGSAQFPASENGYTVEDDTRATDAPRCPVPTDRRSGPQPLRSNCPLPAWFTPAGDGSSRPAQPVDINQHVDVDPSDPAKGFFLDPQCFKAADYNHDRCWLVGALDTEPPLTMVSCGPPTGLTGPIGDNPTTYETGPATQSRDVAAVGQKTLADFVDNVELGCIVTKTWHLDMHVLANGAMALTKTSPKDPIFYRIHQLLSGVSIPSAGNGTARTRALDAAASETLYEQWEDHMAAGPPGLTMRFPYPGYPLASLTGVAVAFWEPVSGVQAGNLLVNGAPAMMVDGSGKGPYIFTGFPMIPAPPSGTTTAVTVQLLPGNIRDADNNGFAGDTWAYTLEPDRDGDGVPDSIDNCPDVANPLQENSSRYIVHGGDPTGHCTCGAIFPGHPEGDACSDDWDGDGFSNELEIQLGSDPKSNASIPDPTQLPPGTCSTCAQGDFDGDGVPNASDGCYTDPNKTAPGICGCNAPDVDSDGDGTFDCADACPQDSLKTDPGDCGCGFTDLGRDASGQPICASTSSVTPTPVNCPSPVLATPAPPTMGPTTPPGCIGDCNANGVVTISELITGVLIALEEKPVRDCVALDVNHDGRVTIDELVEAVQSALVGCSRSS